MEIFDLIDFMISLFVTQVDTMQIQEPMTAFLWLPMAIGAAASIGGSLMSASKNRKNERKLSAMVDDEKSDYLREYYRGALDNEGSKAYLKKLDQRLKRSDKATENALTATGATHENALAAKQANNEVYSDAVASLVESEQGRKDQVRAQHKQESNNLANAQMQQNAQQAATWSNLGQGIADAAIGVGNAMDWKKPQ